MWVPLATLAQNGGNSTAAQACQQGGYADLVGVQDGLVTVFGNTGECVSYAALGGQLVSPSVVSPCLDGGYAGLARIEDDRTAFASQEACVAYAVGGGTLVAVVLPSITVTISPTGDPNYCAPRVTLSNFASNITYTVTSTILLPSGGSASWAGNVTTDANGNYGPYEPIGSLFEGSGRTFSATAAGVSSGPITYTC